MTRTLLSIGECMIEFAEAGDGLFRRGYAGDTFNTAWHARRFLPDDWTVAYFTAVGDDAASADMLAFMTEAGIASHFVSRIPGRAPGLYVISTDQGERSFSYWRDTSAARLLASDAEHLEAAIAASDVIFFSGITLAILSPDDRAALLRALEKARLDAKTVVFDSNLRPRLWPGEDAMREAIRQAAAVTTLALPTHPDESELFGEPDAAAIAARYLDAGCTEVVVKAGAGPSLVCADGKSVSVAPETVKRIVDTTGAGDSFNGAYLAARLSGMAPADAARRAHGIAARVIQAPGALVAVS